MPTRKSLSKKTRFEVFARDSFTCQYCGNQPPKVILEVDHIIPVVDGGTNDPENLRTSCFECNRGKGKSVLGNEANPMEKLAKMQELSEEQMFAIKLVEAARVREEIRNNAISIIENVLKISSCFETHVSQFLNIAKEFSPETAMEWLQIAASTVSRSSGIERSATYARRLKHENVYENDCFKYLNGIRRKYKSVEAEQ